MPRRSERQFRMAISKPVAIQNSPRASARARGKNLQTNWASTITVRSGTEYLGAVCGDPILMNPASSIVYPFRLYESGLFFVGQPLRSLPLAVDLPLFGISGMS